MFHTHSVLFYNLFHIKCYLAVAFTISIVVGELYDWTYVQIALCMHADVSMLFSVNVLSIFDSIFVTPLITELSFSGSPVNIILSTYEFMESLTIFTEENIANVIFTIAILYLLVILIQYQRLFAVF